MMMTQNNQVEWGKKWEEEEEGWRRAEEPGGVDAESGFIDCSCNNLYHLICLFPSFDCEIVFMTKKSKLDELEVFSVLQH